MGASNLLASLTPAHTAPVDGVATYSSGGGGAQNLSGLGVVPEHSGVNDAPGSPESENLTSREWASKVVNLCNAVVHDRNADEFTKEQAMLLRCEAHEHLLNH